MGRKRDRFWDHAERLDGQFKCNYCDEIFAGGISRLKPHLAKIKRCGVDICTKVPEDVRVAAAEAISDPNKRAKTEACSDDTEETSPKMLISKDRVMPDKLLAKFILLNDLDINIVRRPEFLEFLDAVVEHGSHYKPPCFSVVKTELVPALEKEIGDHVANMKKSWDRTGCTLISAIWCDKGRSFINFFAYSVEGVVLLSTLDIHQDELTSTLLRKTLYSVTQEIGANNIVQYITNSSQKEGFYEDMPEDMPIGNYPHVYQTNCVAHEIDLLFEDIYDGITWVRKVFDQARAVFTKVHKHDGILLSMKKFTNSWELEQSSPTKFYSNYYMLQSIVGVEKELQLLVSSPEWPSLGFEKDESGVEVGEIIRSSEFWSEGKEVLHALDLIFQVIRLVDSSGATSGFLYAAVEMAIEAIRQLCATNVHKYQRLWEFFKLRESNVIHPIHAAAAFLNPAYMCSEKFVENKAMKQGMDFILGKLVGGEEKAKFVEDMLLYRRKEKKLFTDTAMTMLQTSHPREWWDYCGDDLPVLKKYAIQILSQPCSTSFCRQSLSAFETDQTKKRKPLTCGVVDPYLRTNALLMENFNTMKEKFKKLLDLGKLGKIPGCTEYINENSTCDLLNETKAPSSDGKLNCWFALARKDGESEKDLHLHFVTDLPSSLVKGNEVKGEGETPIQVALVDSRTGSVVESGRLSELELTVTVIGGDFDEEAGKNWNRDFFESDESKIMKREGKMPLLTGDLSVVLKEGMGTLGAITFNDISSWTRSGKFRLGVKTEVGYCEGIRVYEGLSNAFAVEDANTGNIRTVLSVEGVEVTEQSLWSRSRCQIGNASPVVSRSFGDTQEAACGGENDAVSVPPERTVQTAIALHGNYNIWNSKKDSEHEDCTVIRRWKPPKAGTLKANIDGSFDGEAMVAAVACVCRNSEGVLVDGFSKLVPASSALQAECRAFNETLTFLLSRKHECISLESDSLCLLNGLQCPDQAVWEVRLLIYEGLALMAHFSSLDLAHCHREANWVADWAAKAQRKKTIPLNWVSSPPRDLLDLLCTDAHLDGLGVFSYK